jgi:type III secretion protein L
MSDKIIKAAVVHQGQKVVKQEVFDAGMEAALLLEQAERQVESTREQAKADATVELEKARQAGYEEGLKQWNEAVQAAVAGRDQYLRDCEPEVVKLAVRIAEKILGEHLKANPDSIVSIVRETLRGLRQERNLTILVHTSDVEALRDKVKLLEEQAGEDCRIRIKGSSTVAAGGCVIETELGTIDAKLETQLKCLEEVLLRETKR